MHLSRRTFLTTVAATLSISAICALRGYPIELSETVHASSTDFDLSNWKLQIPGPKEIKDLSGYESKYFYRDSFGSICFWVDCTETGHTAHSQYVRSELHHLKYWRVSDINKKALAVTVSVKSKANPDKITILQIHRTGDGISKVRPLLRIAVNNGSLFAFLKTDNSGDNTEKIALQPNVGSSVFDCAVTVVNQNLIIKRLLNIIKQFAH